MRCILGTAGGFWHDLKLYKMSRQASCSALTYTICLVKGCGETGSEWALLCQLSGRYMDLPFYAVYASNYKPTNRSAWSDIALQFNLYHTNCRRNGTNLVHHDYDEFRLAIWTNNITCASLRIWIRAMGSYSMPLVDPAYPSH